MFFDGSEVNNCPKQTDTLSPNIGYFETVCPVLLDNLQKSVCQKLQTVSEQMHIIIFQAIVFV